MYKEIKPISWVNEKISELKKEKAKNRHRYLFLSFSLILINLATVIVAIFAIDYLYESSGNNTWPKILSISSAVAVVSIFLLNNINIYYKGVMKEKQYKRAIDSIQHEVMLFNNKTGSYIGKDKEEQLVKVVEKIQKKSISKKRKKSLSLILRGLSGGEEDV
ncbi:MAG: DUF4231 domain-containing protein [Mycoplasmataceae bacterium]|nr:DUF4231 domain-containing protein [Mycoplasmataceae bacterium]